MFNLSSAVICQEMSERAHRLGPDPVKREARAAWLATQKAAGKG